MGRGDLSRGVLVCLNDQRILTQDNEVRTSKRQKRIFPKGCYGNLCGRGQGDW